MDRYLGGEEIDTKMLIDDLEKAVARGSFYPVLAARGARPGVGMVELLEVITQGFPSPLEHPLPEITTIDGTPVADMSLRPGRPAGRRGRQDHERPVRRAGSAWSGSSPARCART